MHRFSEYPKGLLEMLLSEDLYSDNPLKIVAQQIDDRIECLRELRSITVVVLNAAVIRCSTEQFVAAAFDLCAVAGVNVSTTPGGERTIVSSPPGFDSHDANKTAAIGPSANFTPKTKRSLGT